MEKYVVLFITSRAGIYEQNSELTFNTNQPDTNNDIGIKER